MPTSRMSPLLRKPSAAVIDDDDLDAIEPRLYEVCIVTAHPMNQKEESVLSKEIENLFAEAGAKQVEKDIWGRRGLAYPIKGATEGNFMVLYYELDPRKLKEIDEALRIISGVLRHMIVKPPKGYQIVKYSALHEQWQKERETLEEKRTRTEEEKLREKVVAKARRQVRRAEEEKTIEKAPEVKEEKMSKEKLTEEIEKIISDDELGL